MEIIIDIIAVFTVFLILNWKLKLNIIFDQINADFFKQKTSKTLTKILPNVWTVYYMSKFIETSLHLKLLILYLCISLFSFT